MLSEYEEIRNKLISQLKKARNRYYESMFSTVSNHPNKIWSAVGKFKGNQQGTNPGTLTFDDIECSDVSLAKKFNDQYLLAGGESHSLMESEIM